jgi:hypothetical protein
MLIVVTLAFANAVMNAQISKTGMVHGSQLKENLIQGS